MKVRIAYTVEVDDTFRIALSHYYGAHGKASRDDLVRWFRDNGDTLDADVLDEDYGTCQRPECQP